METQGLSATTGDEGSGLAGLAEDELPPGNHPLEIAARKGYGPLSPRAREVWHGGGVPCVTCGQLVPRSDVVCSECGQDLSPDMLQKMRAASGPWYVLEHVRPFPGISLDRVIRQIRKGVIFETSIIRGPTTFHQWRFARETPGVAKYFGRCWNCQSSMPTAATYCPACLCHVDGLNPTRPLTVPSVNEIPQAAEGDDQDADEIEGVNANHASPASIEGIAVSEDQVGRAAVPQMGAQAASAPGFSAPTSVATGSGASGRAAAPVEVLKGSQEWEALSAAVGSRRERGLADSRWEPSRPRETRASLAIAAIVALFLLGLWGLTAWNRHREALRRAEGENPSLPLLTETPTTSPAEAAGSSTESTDGASVVPPPDSPNPAAEAPILEGGYIQLDEKPRKRDGEPAPAPETPTDRPKRDKPGSP